jgi:acyl carrier protein
MTTTFERLRAILVKDYQLDPDLLTPEVSFESLGIDSLGTAELLFNVEDEFKVRIPSQPAALATMGDVVLYIDGLIAAQQAAPGSASAVPISAAQNK